MKVTLNWGMCVGNVWCDFNRVNLNHEIFNSAYGIYIIWSNAITVKIGTGNIKAGILSDRNNPNIISLPDLKVTWSNARNEHLDGIKRFLTEKLKPGIQEPGGVDEPIEVNFPWH